MSVRPRGPEGPRGRTGAQWSAVAGGVCAVGGVGHRRPVLGMLLRLAGREVSAVVGSGLVRPVTAVGVHHPSLASVELHDLAVTIAAAGHS